MPRQSEIDRMIVLLYHSNNAHDYVNFTRYAGWMDDLPMKGLEELARMFEVMREDVQREIAQRIEDGIPTYPRKWYDEQAEAERGGREILRSIGVNTAE